MTFYVENETEITMDFSYEEIVQLICETSLDYVDCPYEVEVNILLTNHENIQVLNHQYRMIERPTDVLSFPNIEYAAPATFATLEDECSMCFHPESGELILGDIIVNLEKVMEQAITYNHSQKREFAFLIAHSMLHLFGYDHETEEEAKIMEEMQCNILNKVNITRML